LMTSTELAVCGGTESGNGTTGAVTEDDSDNAFGPRSYTKSLRRQERCRLPPRRAVLLPKWRGVRKTAEVRQKKDTSRGLKMTLTLTLGASEQISVFCVIQDRVVTFLLSWTRMARLKTCRLQRAVPRHRPTKTQVLLTFSSSTKDYGSVPRGLIR
jgi:hypothetical protein